MTTAEKVPPTGRTVLGRVLRAPVSCVAWRRTAQVVAGLPIALLASSVVWTLGVCVVILAVTAVLAVPFLAALFGCSRTFSQWQRSRVQGFVGDPLPALPPTAAAGDGGSWLRRLGAQTRDAASWRQVGYHALTLFSSPISVVIVIGCWTVGAMAGTIAIYAWSLPERIFLDLPLHNAGFLALVTVAGVLLFLAAPWVAELAAALDLLLIRSMLSPTHVQELAQRVESLSESRADVMDAADAERRRLERDLHDGTQQRLVSLAMNLGMTRTTLVDVPEHVRGAIEDAHEEAKLALSELRDFVRGLHPAVLDDLGLDAALSGITARSPVPVRLLVDLPVRPPRAVETVAYFIVSEALANVAKHAKATRIDVVVEQLGPQSVQVIVSDNGVGGADADRGTGLRGLGQRVRALDGSITVESPVGGPTLLTAVLPYRS